MKHFIAAFIFISMLAPAYANADKGGAGVLCAWYTYTQFKITIEQCVSSPRLEQNYEDAFFWFSLIPTSNPNAYPASTEMKDIKRHLTTEKINVIKKRAENWKPISIKAEGDSPQTQYERGMSYQLGLNVQQDYKEAEKWLLLAAQQGVVDAQYNLGLLYTSESDGGVKDEEFLKTLNKALDKINNFIVKNSVKPITKAELEEQAKQNLSYSCPGNGTIRSMINKIKTVPADKFEKAIDELLAIPGPPKMEPCF